MEAPEALDLLREMVCSLVSECLDASLLDLIYQLLSRSSLG